MDGFAIMLIIVLSWALGCPESLGRWLAKVEAARDAARAALQQESESDV